MNAESNERPQLDRLQSWMQMVITHPGGVRPGVTSRDARQIIDVDLTDLDAVLNPSATLTAAERLAIYSRSYHARLLQCFQSMFPALLHALGEDLFNYFAVDYLQHHPPQSYTLDQLADAFPRHLETTRPDADLSPEERESWPDFIVDLATLELAVLKVFDGPGLEGTEGSAAVDILRLPADRLLDARPAPAPSLRLFSFRTPVHAYWLDFRGERNPTLPLPAQSFVAVTRKNYRVTVHQVLPSQYAFLQALDGRRTVRQAWDESTRAGNLPVFPAVTIVEWLRIWMNSGFLQQAIASATTKVTTKRRSNGC